MENNDNNIALVCTECGCVSFHVLKSGHIECFSCGNVRDLPMSSNEFWDTQDNFQLYERMDDR